MRCHPRHPRGHSSTIRAAICGIFFVLVGRVLFITVEAQSGFYQVIDLGLHTPFEINVRNQVAVRTQQNNFAAVWEAGTVRLLSMPSGFERSGATGLNNQTQIIGFVEEKATCLSGPG